MKHANMGRMHSKYHLFHSCHTSYVLQSLQTSQNYLLAEYFFQANVSFLASSAPIPENLRTCFCSTGTALLILLPTVFMVAMIAMFSRGARDHPIERFNVRIVPRGRGDSKQKRQKARRVCSTRRYLCKQVWDCLLVVSSNACSGRRRCASSWWGWMLLER